VTDKLHAFYDIGMCWVTSRKERSLVGLWYQLNVTHVLYCTS
jgi:hypothetical protein